MNAKMLCTSFRKPRSLPSFRSSDRVTVNGSPPREWFGSLRRGAGPRPALAFWRDTGILRFGSLASLAWYPLAVALPGREMEIEHAFHASAKNFEN
jgi:hypothetical protein